MTLEQQIRFDLIRDLMCRGFSPTQAIAESERLAAYVLNGKAPEGPAA